ncbi:type I restriction modification DNA specificity domain protein [Bacillus cereus]|uniref:restriction endonuclease subunit S n=1 Tax=Bacillus cereus TaxID=1396 RepID=UPI00030FE165|nr:restriction endonuclease subunit S [Bacillus cereus]AJH62083.1 type I restriction modification DNA specificity domain protein [Bacillus cereus]AJK33981.1 type I restriction modification DNA specificity domain protein [Bacillus cereus]MCU5695717.1 restriction endonuclease subunit S [Bacillus cereus]
MKNKRTPDIRFPGFFNNWERCKLDKILKERKVKQKISKELPLLAFAAGQGVIDRSERKTNNRDFLTKDSTKKTYLLTKYDDIVYNPSNLKYGAIDRNKHGQGVISPIYVTFETDEIPSFIELIVKSENFKQRALQYEEGTVTKRQSVKPESLLCLNVVLPNSKDEQIRIGNFFKQLDDTIALHQQELTTLKQTKQGFLKKMFPKEGESTPKVRFPGFTGEWEQRKLDSIVDRVKSYSLSRDVETIENTGYKYIHYGDIHTKVADIIDESSNLPNIKVGNYELLEKGDLVLADASEDYQGIAAPAIITIDTPYKLVSGLHTIALRPKQVDSLFLYYLINSPIFRKFGYKTGTGMKVFGISVTNLLKFESVFPLLEEQVKIGNFFKKIDDTIALHQCKLDALKETKKAFLQKIFV